VTPAAGALPSGGATADQALPIEAGSVEGIVTADSEAWYVISAPGGSVLTLTLTPAATAAPLILTVKDPVLNTVAESKQVAAGTSVPVQLVLGSAAAGKYTAGVQGEGAFTLEVAIATQNDAQTAADGPDKDVSAAEITPAANLLGQVGNLDPEDWFKFTVPGGQVIALTAAPVAISDQITATLFAPDQTQIWESVEIHPTAETRYVTSADTGGEYTLRLTGEGAYTLSLAVAEQNDAEPGDAGDTMELARPIKPDLLIKGELGGDDLEDWYTLPVSSASVISVTFSPLAASEGLSAYIYGPDETELWSAIDVMGGKVAETRQALDASVTGDYWLRVTGDRGQYELGVTLSNQNDGASDTDAGNSESGAVELLAGTPAEGEIGAWDQEDWYVFTPSEGQKLIVSAGPTVTGLQVTLYDADLVELDSAEGITSAKSATLDIIDVATDTYYVRVSGAEGPYALELID